MKLIAIQSLSRWMFLLVGFVAPLAAARAQTAFEVVHFSASTMPSAQVSTEAPLKRNAPLLWAHLAKPKEPGSYPAIILLHGCNGVIQSHLDWAALLVDAGYVALVVDSFRPRSLMNDCAGRSGAASPTARALDAFGALDFLSQQEFVDPERIGLIGWSHGGISALAATTAKGFGERFENTFKAVAAFYPYCIEGRTFSVPVMILMGDADDWVPPSTCRNLAQQNAGKEVPVDLIVYPGAYHSFDKPSVGSGFYFPGEPGQRHWLQYDEAAHVDAQKRVVAFFSEHL